MGNRRTRADERTDRDRSSLHDVAAARVAFSRPRRHAGFAETEHLHRRNWLRLAHTGSSRAQEALRQGSEAIWCVGMSKRKARVLTFTACTSARCVQRCSVDALISRARTCCKCLGSASVPAIDALMNGSALAYSTTRRELCKPALG